MAVINDLPEEILVHIFSYYVLTEKQCKLVSVLRKVSKTWENASKSSQLWKTFDGSILYSDFLEMCKSNEFQFQNTREVIFSKTNLLLEVRKCDLDVIYSNLPSLKRIDFSLVEKVKDLFFDCLQDRCPNLSEIVLRKEYNNYRTVVTISNKIVDYLTLCGSKITHLNISYSSLPNVHKLFLVVSDSCSNLEELIAKHIEDTSSEKKFPIGNVQKGCPKLKILCLGWPMSFYDKSWDLRNGFPELEVFTHRIPKRSQYEHFPKELFKKLLSHSNKLKVLDLRGCIGLSAEDLLFLPARDLQKLYISDTWVFSYLGDSLEFLRKWQHSLVKLDFSAFSYNFISRTGVWNYMENLKSVKFSVQSDADIGDFYLEIMKNCCNLKSLEIIGCKKRRRLW